MTPDDVTSSTPVISVIMGVYNGADHLRECIDSLFGQTFEDWELVVCDDGSTDGTQRLLAEFQRRDPRRVVVLLNERNQGLAFSLNRCIAAARGRLLARQDADDSSLPARLATQAAFLEQNPRYGWVSTAMVVFDGARDIGVLSNRPEPSTWDLVRQSCFFHAPSMLRATVVRAVGGYRVASYTRRTEDYDLWMRLFAAGHRGANLPDPLYRVREDASAYARRTYRFRLQEAATRLHGYRAMGVPPWAYMYVARPLLVGAFPWFTRWVRERRARVARR